MLQVGLLGLVLLAGAAWSGSQVERVPGLSIGLRGGGILPSTDLSGKIGPQGALFMRYGLGAKLQAEVGVAYNQYIVEDYAWGPLGSIPAATDEYMTNLSTVQLRLVWAPVRYPTWNPFVYAGAGFEYFNVEDLRPTRGSWDGIGSSAEIPLGIGARYQLAERWGLEGSGGYAFSFSKKTDGSTLSGATGSKDEGGKNNYLEFNVGLTYDITLGEVIERPAKPVAAVTPAPAPIAKVEAPKDSDGDGLTDDDEQKTYFTNARVADSDGDGLSDGDEVRVYRTNPNKADTDQGGITDGDEVKRGTDPLAAADDKAQVEERAIPAPAVGEFTFPVVYFPTGGSVLSAQAKADLNKAGKVLLDNPGVLLDVVGHADNQGSAAANKKLSRARAENVKAYLVQQGVATWRIMPSFYGDTKPAASNDTAEGKAKNRRVELLQAK